jgi:hypothetical protein
MEQKALERHQARHSNLALAERKQVAAPGPSSRWAEAVPGALSWLVVLAPVWLTILNPQAGLLFVTGAATYFVFRVSSYGLRSLLNRSRTMRAMRADWLSLLASLPGDEWRQYKLTLMIRAYREGNIQMLRATLESIYDSNWLRDEDELRNVEVVFATEVDDPITPPIVATLAAEFRGRLKVRQIRHPKVEGHLPGPSSAMHYAGRVLYREALQSGFPPYRWLVADFDCDTLFHPQYIPGLIYHFATDPMRHRHAYQPIVLFTTDYWKAPLHSRLAALGTSVLTLGWNRRPQIAFTGAAASLALLKSVDFWPTNSHSQDSGIELRLKLRYGSDFRVVGIPIPLRVYTVMMVGQKDSTIRGWFAAYAGSFKALFRQSARWREGPLDEFVESTGQRHAGLSVYKLFNGLERDTLTLLPAIGPLTAQLVILSWFGGQVQPVPAVSLIMGLAAVLTFVSLIGIMAFGQVLRTPDFVGRSVPFWRWAAEIGAFWVVFSIYVPIITACAGLRTSTAYLLGQRPRGHYVPTPK